MTPICRDRARLYARLIRSRMLCRSDRLCHKAPWGAPCPLEAGEALEALLLSHLLGEGGRRLKARWVTRERSGWSSGPFRLGSYCPTPDGMTTFACVDCDGGGHSSPLADPLAAALAVQEALRRYDLFAHLERSRGGGWHVWLFFSRPVPAASARRVLLMALPREVPLAGGGFADARRNAGLEVFPKQAAHDYMGNQVWLPWWHGADWPRCQFHRRAPGGGVEPYLPTSFRLVRPELVEVLDPGPAPVPQVPRRCGFAPREGPPSTETLLNWALRRVSPGTQRGRNRTGFDLARQLRDNGYTRAEAEGVLRQYARLAPGGEAAYTEAEALASLGQAYRQAPGRPWGRTG